MSGDVPGAARVEEVDPDRTDCDKPMAGDAVVLVALSVAAVTTAAFPHRGRVSTELFHETRCLDVRVSPEHRQNSLAAERPP